MLVKAGVKVDARNDDGNTALDLANAESYDDIVKILESFEDTGCLWEVYFWGENIAWGRYVPNNC